jgi:membrane protein DedA with SNARE-associated domain
VDWLTDWLIRFVSAENNPAGLAVLTGSAAVEYIFPPFPGDTITLFGAVLITAYGWSFAAVFGSVMIGSVAGAMAAFYFGHRLRLWRSRRPRKQATRLAVIDRLVTQFQRRGPAYLVVNRFLPGIRALFFVAAGLAGMKPLPVLFYSALSAALWNLGIIALGSLLGASFETLLAWVTRYTAIVWILIALVVLFFVGKAIWRRRRRGRA